MKNQKNAEKKKNSYTPLIFAAVVALLFTVTMLVYFKVNIAADKIMTDESGIDYTKEYAFITKDSSDDFWSPVYDQMKSYGDENGIYIQWMGKNITGDYSWAELMEIAREADVDGIIVEADDSEESHYGINKAVYSGIPVVTVRTDSQLSKRISYVGVSYYNLGTEYGNLILSCAGDVLKKTYEEEESTEKTEDEKAEKEALVKVMVLMDKDTSDTSQNTILLAIQEQLNKNEELSDLIEVTPLLIDNSSDFSAEESVQDLLKDPNPADIIICLNEINTVSVYQAIVEQNKVGDTIIIGYSDNDTVLNAIEKNIVYATITADVDQLGKSCIEALMEYSEYGRVSDYYSVNFTVINNSNVKQFVKKEVTDEAQ